MLCPQAKLAVLTPSFRSPSSTYDRFSQLTWTGRACSESPTVPVLLGDAFISREFGADTSAYVQKASSVLSTVDLEKVCGPECSYILCRELAACVAIRSRGQWTVSTLLSRKLG